MADIKAVSIVIVLALVSLVFIPLQWLAIKLRLPIQKVLPCVWHKIAARMVGIKIQQMGEPCRDRPLLLTSNHASWLDIAVFGSLMPLSFIAKSEVSGWPVFGLLAKLQRTVFVNREKRSETGNVANEIAERMAAGDAMVLFAEGTSNDGNSVLPFRSALIGAATRAAGNGRAGTQVWVQPVSIAYQGFYGIPMGRAHRPHVAWYGEMELAGHLWGIFRRGALDVIVSWGDPILINAATDRKALTRHLEQEVRSMTLASLRQKQEPQDISLANEPVKFFQNEEKPAKAGR
ncbi:1-acyl-sn-glycerol-3-phosphate acyltransferase [Roseibium denhamense]|uniref:Lyso-ornithine lipid acyltransferase n=1 Tax=Roseibium denhamense TaxID=76305 RepID=A0ABY1PLP9_9HYPH|nr:lysophospholipid acyltransferase family protein [Roseibium denhamense]MTI06939.1 1-acyl-sn-glycerol-3-phosphate acyltransferase [Roseibium denhamense]SMP36728.1 lyso-ornithine lipid acyltransferase [Roseibium denhamense]